MNIELKIFDEHFNYLSKFKTKKPILCMTKYEEKKMVITGSLGLIQVWYLEQGYGEEQNYSYQIRELVSVSDINEDAWITQLYIEPKSNTLYASYDSDICKIDMKTWKKKETYKNLHDLHISCFVVYRPLEYLITGGKDGKSNEIIK
ncbi:hypothetical protein H8356DRAFT_1272106 [Neocallimastix lanati (nom. inval.)]|uniref:WD40 repeat-like protein n=1 Tax=Neocallimastix californiae TaxID=1754190 RepID=A0A1Y2BK36_9FUNG|nr:hypothetical protein H8356DRAFT_1272106 [Neocallimastix sp. JGI-2020a]ORY35129.1 hypothetical protein LY90DRAFT_64300 [Neocallimastix californiae]|eukprot:ORY35129.1 hypothetical protein LY90DRAFT_64300 [Neocallimastix californiae]